MKTLEESGRDVPVVRPASQRLFSEEVGIAEGYGNPLPEQSTAYEFSNGRKFVDGGQARHG